MKPCDSPLTGRLGAGVMEIRLVVVTVAET